MPSPSAKMTFMKVARPPIATPNKTEAAAAVRKSFTKVAGEEGVEGLKVWWKGTKDSHRKCH